MLIWRFLTAVCVIGVGGVLAVGQCPTVRTGGHVNQNYQVEEVVQAVDAVQVVVPAYFPVYIASYVPPANPPAPLPPAAPLPPVLPPGTPPAVTPLPPGPEDVNQAILAELRKMNKKLDQLLAPPGPGTPDGVTGTPAAPAVDPAVATMLRVVGNTCIKCHHAGTAEDKGGGFVMVNAQNQTMNFTPAELRRIRARVSDGSMPKGGTRLTEDEKAAMLKVFAH